MTTRRLLAAPAAAFLLLVGCAGGSGDAAEVAEVTGEEVVQTVAAPASLAPAERVEVTAPAPGEVAAVLVDDGARVEAGAEVVRLTSGDLEAAIRQAEAGIAAADALADVPPALDLSPLLRTLREQINDAVPPLLDALEAQAEGLDDEDARAAAMLRLNDARAAHADTLRDLRRAEAEAAEAARRSTAGQRAAAGAQRRQAEAALDAAQDRTENLTLTAPIAGIVEFPNAATTAAEGDTAGLPQNLSGLLGGGDGARIVAGAVVAPGQVLFTVYDLSSFRVEATVDEVDAVDVRDGQDATVFVDAYPDREFPATVTRMGIAPRRGAAGGVVYPVTVVFQPPPDDVVFRVGMTASVEITVARVRSETVVPARALVRRDGSDAVLAVRDEGDGRVVRVVPVQVVATGGDRAAVDPDGELEAGDEVVVSAVEDLRDGDRLP